MRERAGPRWRANGSFLERDGERALPRRRLVASPEATGFEIAPEAMRLVASQEATRFKTTPEATAEALLPTPAPRRKDRLACKRAKRGRASGAGTIVRDAAAENGTSAPEKDPA